MAVYILIVRATVKAIKVIGDCLISMVFLKFISGFCSEFRIYLSLRGATEWLCAQRELDLSVTIQKRWKRKNESYKRP